MLKLRRQDLNIISDLIEPNTKVLDLGSGDGTLLRMLKDKKKVIPYGIEIDENNLVKCLAKGLPVFQSDIDSGLGEYKKNSFDYVILSQTLQTVKRPYFVIKEMLRVGKKCIVSFPNFGFIGTRLFLLLKGRMPRTKYLAYNWYDTPNIHHLTIKDFYRFCEEFKIKIIKKIFLKNYNDKMKNIKLLPNLLADVSIFVITKE